MKKIFLSLLLGFAAAATSVQAQSFKALTTFDASQTITSLADLTEGYYALYNTGRGWYLKYNLLSGNMSISSSIDVSSAEAGLFVFKITPVTSDGSTTYTIETAVSGYYMPETQKSSNSTPVSTTSDNAYKFTITESDATNHYFSIVSNGIYFNGNQYAFVGWNEAGGNSNYKIIKVTPDEATLCRVVTSQVKLNDNVYSSSKAIYKDGVSVTSPASPFSNSSYYITVTAQTSTITVGDGATEATTTVTTTKGTPPVTFNKVCALKTRAADYGDEFGIKGVASGNINVHANINNASTYNDFLYHMWQLEETTFGVKIKNIKTGTYLTSSSTLSAEGTEFYFKNEKTDGTFDLTADGTNPFGNHSGWNGYYNVNLSTWSGNGASFTDKGSIFTPTYVNDSETLRTLAKTCLKNDYSDVAPGNYVQANYASYIDGTTVSTFDDITTLATNVTKQDLPPVDLDENAYYRIESVNTNNVNTLLYLSSESTTVNNEGSFTTAQTIGRTSSSDNIVAQLWKLEGSNGEYTLCNVNNGAKLGECSATQGVGIQCTTGDGATYKFTSKPNVTWDLFTNTPGYAFLLTQGSQRINAFQGKHNTIVCDYSGNHDRDCGNYWMIEKIDTVPVTISSVGYASVCFPFAVTIPDGVTAFYATKAQDGKVYLESYDGIIPAKAGAIIKGDAREHKFVITTETGTTETTILEGATAERTGFASGEIYGLGATSAGKAALMKSTIDCIAANKAYMKATEIPSSEQQVSAFDFTYGGVVDGIESATTSPAADKEVYYNLQGQRVLYPTTGIYVTASGQKVFIK